MSFIIGDVVRHKKGGVYIIKELPSPMRLLAENAEQYYTYSGYHNGRIDTLEWRRCVSEMEDGRFKKLR